MLEGLEEFRIQVVNVITSGGDEARFWTFVCDLRGGCANEGKRRFILV